MSFLDRLERYLGRFALPGIPLIIVAGQVLTWLMTERGLVSPTLFVLLPAAVHAGQWWRLLSFLFAAPHANIIFLIFGWWLFYFMGTALEGFWGTFRFNAFLLLGYALTVGAGFLFPFEPVNNLFIGGSVFLAFAYLNPNFELSLFLILPIRIKWLALLAWLGYGVEFVQGSWSQRFQVVAICVTFVLFFGHDLWLTLRLRGRAMSAGAARIAPVRAVDEPRHRCRVCGKTDRTNPEMDFRYCSKCAGEMCYCPEHIFHHEHVTLEHEAGKRT